MKCFTKQVANALTLPPEIDCPENGTCYIKWRQENKDRIIEEQGCSNDSNYDVTIECDIENGDCPSYEVGTNSYACCCKNVYGMPCNYFNFYQPWIREPRASPLVQTTTEKLVYNETFHPLHTIKLSTLILPLSALAFCFVLVIYIWQKHVYEKERTSLQEANTASDIKSPDLTRGCGDKCNWIKHAILNISPKAKPAKHYNRIKEQEYVENITLLMLKGQGRYGTVWKGLSGKSTVAVKLFNKCEKQSYDNELAFYNLPGSSSHPNILKFFGVCNTKELTNNSQSVKEDFGLILHYYEKGNLENYLKNYTVGWTSLLKMATGMASGLAFLHEPSLIYQSEKKKPSVVHRDFKSSNILLKEDLTCCISDFGFAHIFTEHDHSLMTESFVQVGTKHYMAPELLDRSIGMTTEAFRNVDMYAFGIVFWEILSRFQDDTEFAGSYTMPFEKEVGCNPSIDRIHDLVVMQKIRPKFKDSWLSHDKLKVLVDIITECWDSDPDARVSAGCVEQRLLELTDSFNQNLNSSISIEVQMPESDMCTSSQQGLNSSLTNYISTPTSGYKNLNMHQSFMKSQGLHSSVKSNLNVLLSEKSLSSIDGLDSNNNGLPNQDEESSKTEDQKSLYKEEFETLSVLELMKKASTKVSGKHQQENADNAHCDFIVNKCSKMAHSCSSDPTNHNFSIVYNDLPHTELKPRYSYQHSRSVSRSISGHNSSGRGSLDTTNFPEDLHLDQEEIHSILNCELDDNVWYDEADGVSGYGSPSNHSNEDVQYDSLQDGVSAPTKV